VSEIRSMLKNHEDIEQNQTLIVNFLAFNASSLDIMVYTFTKTIQWVRYHEVKQDVLLKISDIIESYGAEVAFPTRTLHMPEGVRLAGDRSGSAGGEGSSAEPGAGSAPVDGSAGSSTTQGDSAEATGGSS